MSVGVVVHFDVKRYRRLLERVTEELDRQTILNLLAEEQQKQRDAGDPIQFVGREPIRPSIIIPAVTG